MDLTAALAALGPLAPNAASSLAREPARLLEAVRSAAARRGALVVPPLQSGDCRPSADALFALPNAAGEAYVPGPYPLAGTKLCGALVLELRGLACAAVVLLRETPQPLLEVVVRGAPLSALESQLFTDEAGDVLCTWLGQTAAQARAVREHLGVHLRARGPHAVEALLSDAGYHVERSGPAALLAARAPRDEPERSALELAVASALGVEDAAPLEAPLLEALDALPEPAALRVVLDVSEWPAAECADGAAAAVALRAGEFAVRMADVLLRSALDGCAPAAAEGSPAYLSELDALLSRARAPAHAPVRAVKASAPTLRRLASAACALCAPRLLGDANDRAHLNALFVARDRLFATRGLGTGREGAGGCVVRAVARRVAPGRCVLLVLLDGAERVQRVEQLNAVTERALSFDAAQRLVSCPWCVPSTPNPTKVHT